MPEIAESTSVGELRPCNAQMVTDLVEERDCLVEKLFCSRIRERSVEETGPHELDFGAELGPAVIREGLATTFVVPGQTVEVGALGELVIEAAG